VVPRHPGPGGFRRYRTKEVVKTVSVALVTIATGETYRQYARSLHHTAALYFPAAKFVLFSDHDRNPGVDLWFRTQPKGFPDETLYRYHTLLKQANTLRQFQHIFHLDADMEFVAPVGVIGSYGITATLHPGHLGQTGPVEDRPSSWAYGCGNLAYYCGGFQGGETGTYLAAAARIAKGVDQDYRNGITAKWHDESHWNRY